jgi:hypothetical protein
MPAAARPAAGMGLAHLAPFLRGGAVSNSMSEFRIDKERRSATLTLSDGRLISGSFFLAATSLSHNGPERVKDVLNGESAFFPFEVRSDAGVHAGLYNRDQVVLVRLSIDEAHGEAAYEVAKRQSVSMLLSNGVRLTGLVRVYCPRGHDRLSDYTRADETFRYVQTADALLIVNFRHVLELIEVEAA